MIGKSVKSGLYVSLERRVTFWFPILINWKALSYKTYYSGVRSHLPKKFRGEREMCHTMPLTKQCELYLGWVVFHKSARRSPVPPNPNNPEWYFRQLISFYSLSFNDQRWLHSVQSWRIPWVDSWGWGGARHPLLYTLSIILHNVVRILGWVDCVSPTHLQTYATIHSISQG